VEPPQAGRKSREMRASRFSYLTIVENSMGFVAAV
jgi:hypothetical protein